MIAVMWRSGGVHYITTAEMAEIGPTSLPQNLFALVIYLNDASITRLGCTAVVAFAAALTALNLYMLSVQFGADSKSALLFASMLYFQPALLFYTSDLYKDGLVLCFTIGALGSALRLSNKLTLLHAAIGVICLWALWYVRFYLMFVTVAPFLVGVVGMGSKNSARPVLAAMSLAILGIALAGFTDFLQLASAKAEAAFATGTSAAAVLDNSRGGSGVVFDDGGSPFGALPAKLAYTIFAPFPWAGGSLGFQLSKIDALLWYFVLYRAYRAAFQVDRRLLIMLGTFVVPATLMYAMSMANVGLIMRQRLVIVAAVAILASLYKPQKVARAAVVTRRGPSPRVARRTRSIAPPVA